MLNYLLLKLARDFVYYSIVVILTLKLKYFSLNFVQFYSLFRNDGRGKRFIQLRSIFLSLVIEKILARLILWSHHHHFWIRRILKIFYERSTWCFIKSFQTAKIRSLCWPKRCWMPVCLCAKTSRERVYLDRSICPIV